MNKFKKNVSKLFLILFHGIYKSSILLIPMLGMMLYVTYGLFGIKVIAGALTLLLVEIYGRYYFKFNKDEYNTKLKIHHDVEKNFVWVESNDTIDSIIDIDIVKHVKLDKNV